MKCKDKFKKKDKNNFQINFKIVTGLGGLFQKLNYKSVQFLKLHNFQALTMIELKKDA